MSLGKPSIASLICTIILIIAITVDNQKLSWNPPLPLDVPLSIEIPDNNIQYEECPRIPGNGEVSLLLKIEDTCNPIPNFIISPLNCYAPQKSSKLLNFAKNSSFY
uniref:ZP domain-containing protein n=1 Tax=Parastrongyloides trichosuri TaxID=131310 RepID=A0A0N5A3W5_PARTI